MLDWKNHVDKRPSIWPSEVDRQSVLDLTATLEVMLCNKKRISDEEVKEVFNEWLKHQDFRKGRKARRMGEVYLRGLNHVAEIHALKLEPPPKNDDDTTHKNFETADDILRQSFTEKQNRDVLKFWNEDGWGYPPFTPSHLIAG